MIQLGSISLASEKRKKNYSTIKKKKKHILKSWIFLLYHCQLVTTATQ